MFQAVKVTTPPYDAKFKVGDQAVSKGYVVFCDGTYHHHGQIIKVTAENVSYYNVNHKDYDKRV